jgi:hypothetical protein
VANFTNSLYAHLPQYSFAKKSSSPKKLRTKLSFEKAARKILVKLTPGVNFTNVLCAAFAPTVLRQ